MTKRAFAKLLTTVLLATVCTTAAAQDMSVFGIPLGQRLALPECEKSETPSSANGYRYEPRPKPRQACFISLAELNIRDRVAIDFAENEKPSVTIGGGWFGIEATVIEGNIEGIKFGTFGIKNASSVLDALTTKYGKPTDLTTSKVQNGFGASFDVFTAFWMLPGPVDPKLTVVFWSSCSSKLDEGCVTIDTKKGRAWRKQKLDENFKDRRPL
ncbi:hypothetical protein BH20ACI3_BH20ACI3_08280 [soil metagenome]